MKTYVPSEVEFSILGIDVDGFPDGTFINIAPQNQTFTFRRALDGSSIATKNAYQEYKLTLTLQQSSSSNDWLQILHGLKKDMQIAIQTPILINDKKGTTSFFATDCWFINEPQTDFGNTLGTVSWDIMCIGGAYKRGGNGDVNNAVFILGAIQTALSLSGVLGLDLGSFSDVLSETVDTVSSTLGDLF